MVSQSSITIGSLVFAFLVFITLRGELARYLAVLFGKGPTSAQQDANTVASPDTSSSSGSGGGFLDALGSLGGTDFPLGGGGAGPVGTSSSTITFGS